jgi:hypothetical protein
MKSKEEIQKMIEKINLIFKHPKNVKDFESIPIHFVTRVELIDENGRIYTNWNTENKVSLDFQDNGLTLKIFII